MNVTYAIGSDHGGFRLKEILKEKLQEKGYQIEDYGTFDETSCNYPDIAEKLSVAVAEGKHPLGILVCGTGIGMSIAANKVNGIRAAAVSDHFGAKYCRLHNNANVLCLGERITGPGAALEMAELFLTTAFEGGRHEKRVEMIMDIQERNSK